MELVARRGPSQGLNSVFEFRLLGGRALPRTPEAVSPVLEAPVNRPEGARPSRRGPLSAVDRAFRRVLRRVGTLLGRTCSNVTRLPADTGGLAVSAGRRSAERETVLAPAAGPQPLDRPPIPPEARWPGRRGGHSVPSSSTCDSGSLLPLVVTTGCYHWLLPRQLGGVALASLFSFGSSLWRGQWQGEFKDTVH